MQQFQKTNVNNTTQQGEFTWKAPSNIALVKYWGKHGNQLPSNPSLSFTLSNCYTQSTLEYTRHDDEGFVVEVLLDGKANESFKDKVTGFLIKLEKELPFLSNYKFVLKTHNSFPHSSGIASSASGMGALALCLVSLELMVTGAETTPKAFFQRASYFARIGSGSACRSVYGGIAVWGRHAELPGSNDQYAIPYPVEVHPVFENFQDTILLIHEGAKSVSSTAGHALMNTHPFARQRFEQARTNLSRLISVLRAGNLDEFGVLVEKEALMLHALMMCSEPPYILMKPNTLAAIEKIMAYRKQTGAHVYFTLDAGANVHVLYPFENKEIIEKFIADELAVYCENKKYICDSVGKGPEAIT